jgi:DNA-binding FadR family transcriptional regulator
VPDDESLDHPPKVGHDGVGSDFALSRAAPRHLKISERLADELVSEILERKLPEGARLPTESQMLEQLNVGRATLREALRLLESRGVITVRPGRKGGPVVRYPRSEDLSASLALVLKFGATGLSDILDAREALEPMLARLAAVRLTESQLEGLRHSVENMEAGAPERSVFLGEHSKFHSIIAEGSGSRVLKVFSDALKHLLDGVIVGVNYGARRRLAAVDSHVRILEALEHRDPVEAEAAMRDHLIEVGEYWKATYPNLFQDGPTP